MKETHKAVIITLIAVWLLLSVAFGSFNPMEWRAIRQEPTGEEPITTVVGIFDLKTKGYNSLDITATLTHETNYYCYWYANRPGGWIMLGSGDQSIELTEQDYGFIYAVVEIPSGQSYYVDFAETKLKNARVVSVSYDDPDGDGYKEFVFKFNMANIPKPASGNPTVYFYPYFIAYQKPSINSPADITGIGTASVDKYIEWYVSFANEKKGYGIVKVEFEINTTDTSKIQLDRMNIPGIGYLTGDQFGTPIKGTNSLTWTYEIGNNLFTANYIKYGANQLNKFEFTTQVTCQLAAGDKIAATITIYGMSVTGTMETITDTVLLSA